MTTEPQPAAPATRPDIVNIEGNLIALGPIRRELLPVYQRWINNFETAKNLALAPAPMTREAEEGWFNGATTGSVAYFTIYERSTWRPVGNIDLRDIDHRNRSASLGILIGEAASRGKGYGTEAVRLVLDYAFTALGLHNVLLSVYEYNPAGRRAYAKAGFKEIGRRRQCRALAGRLWDEIYMDCLATEFESPVLATLMAPDRDRGAG